MRERPPGWLPYEEYLSIYRRVPRLCVEVVVHDPELGVLLTEREIPPNVGAWHIPGGTVLFGERLVDAVARVARDELQAEITVGELLGYIEYPSHYENGLDSPVGLAFDCAVAGAWSPPPEGAWFKRLPAALYAEQRVFLASRLGLLTEPA